jgi:hydroxymethylglutaryl-CoA reductase (NADPH)
VRSWPHRNTERDVAARQAAVRGVPGWGPEHEVALRFPGHGRAAFVGAQECLTGFVALPVATVPILANLGRYRLDPGGNVEEAARETASVLVPLAHTEGGLSMSVERGAMATWHSGGVRTHVVADGMTRASYFQFADTAEAVLFSRWIAAHAQDMAAWLRDPGNPLAAEATSGGIRLLSRHAVLRDVRTHVLGRACHVLYRFTTGDACGPNLMTRNAQALNTHYVLRRFPEETGIAVARSVLEANMGGDKKPSHQYFHEGHGKTVIAEARLDNRVLRRFLKCTAADVVALEQIGLHGSHASGMQSAAFTPASAIAAIFAATGQDLGMVGTSSMAHSTADFDGPDAVHVSIRLSGLEVGTVGGGTSLPHAQAWLTMMGCAGSGTVYRFAQIIAAATLCLEVSAAASMAAQGSENFYQAHLQRGGLRNGHDPGAGGAGGTAPDARAARDGARAPR